MINALKRMLRPRPDPIDPTMVQAMRDSVRGELDEPFEFKRPVIEDGGPATQPAVHYLVNPDRAEFEAWMGQEVEARSMHCLPNGVYSNIFVQAAWEGFRRGRRLA